LGGDFDLAGAAAADFDLAGAAVADFDLAGDTVGDAPSWLDPDFASAGRSFFGSDFALPSAVGDSTCFTRAGFLPAPSAGPTQRMADRTAKRVAMLRWERRDIGWTLFVSPRNEQVLCGSSAGPAPIGASGIL
jgi:hypothetical protein